MDLNIVMGFFLPMPPVAGGATEKSWQGLAAEFARRGHRVTILSRCWGAWPDREIVDGVRHLRLRGYSHTGSLLLNLWHDLQWSRRVGPRLPNADISVVNAISLPIWLRRRHPRCGRVVVMPGRMPKGQYRLYSQVDRILAVSSPVRRAVLRENPGLESVARICGYPIDWSGLVRSGPGPSRTEVVVGYVGRIHREKGLDLLAAALARLRDRSDLPPWRILLAGPSAVEHGGSGEGYAALLESRFVAAVGADRFARRPPQFSAGTLAAIYRELDVFCYPSCNARGETFGVAVAEAMAAGAVPIVSNLPCFTDFVRDGVTGRVFDHEASDAACRLADTIAVLVASIDSRRLMGAAARAAVQIYDFPVFADRLLTDFSTLK